MSIRKPKVEALTETCFRITGLDYWVLSGERAYSDSATIWQPEGTLTQLQVNSVVLRLT
jgi:hypothetical protein